MIVSDGLLCPLCGGELEARGAEALACSIGAHRFPIGDGIADLRADRDTLVQPAPLRTGDFQPALSARARGEPYKSALERVLLALDVVDADRLMQVLGEGRGAWFPLLVSEPASGGILFVGNALSGAVPALAQTGWRVTVLDPSVDRLRFGEYRNEDRYPARTVPLVGGDSPRLPFPDERFAAVVREEGFPGASPVFAPGLDECRRVARDEIVLIGNNRLGYKRSTGRRSIYRMPGPIEWVRDAVSPSEGERSLRGWRRALSHPDFAEPKAYALYPHSSDFTHVVAIDDELPSLTVGRKERRNRLKVAARSLGLFPVLTPSFLLHSTRGPGLARTRRIERMLDAISERTGEPRSELERIVSTRGQSAVLHTRAREKGQEGGPGSWTLYVPFLPSTVERAKRRHEALSSIRRRYPWLPAPDPLFFGRADGVLVVCERRLGGWSAPQIGGDRGRMARMFEDVASHFARLLVRPASPLTAEEFDQVIRPRFELVERHATVPSTIAEVRRLLAEARERLVGRSIPRVFHHADLRAKHVQVREDGSVLGYLDWSVSEDEFLPYQDLLHLVVHERKQEDQISAGDAWRIVRDRRDLLRHERETLERYRREVGIDEETALAIEAIYPVLVAAMAERSWEYSRPRWLHRQFGI